MASICPAYIKSLSRNRSMSSLLFFLVHLALIIPSVLSVTTRNHVLNLVPTSRLASSIGARNVISLVSAPLGRIREWRRKNWKWRRIISNTEKRQRDPAIERQRRHWDQHVALQTEHRFKRKYRLSHSQVRTTAVRLILSEL